MLWRLGASRISRMSIYFLLRESRQLFWHYVSMMHSCVCILYVDIKSKLLLVLTDIKFRVLLNIY